MVQTPWGESSLGGGGGGTPLPQPHTPSSSVLSGSSPKEIPFNQIFGTQCPKSWGRGGSTPRETATWQVGQCHALKTSYDQLDSTWDCNSFRRRAGLASGMTISRGRGSGLASGCCLQKAFFFSFLFSFFSFAAVRLSVTRVHSHSSILTHTLILSSSQPWRLEMDATVGRDFKRADLLLEKCRA